MGKHRLLVAKILLQHAHENLKFVEHLINKKIPHAAYGSVRQTASVLL